MSFYTRPKTGFILIRFHVFSVISALVLCVTASCNSDPDISDSLENYIQRLPRETPLATRGASSFGDLFIYNRVIEIDSTVTIGSINRMSIGADGQIVIIDKPSNQAVLLDSSGSLIQVLSPFECHPGFSWRPKDAISLGSEGWLITVNGQGGFMFDSKGECLIKFGDSNSPNYAHFIAASSQYGYGLSSTMEGIVIDVVEIPSGRSSRLIQASTSNLLQRMVSLGGMQWMSGRLLVGFPTIPFVLSINEEEPNDNNLSVIGVIPDYYRVITEDLSSKENSHGSTAIRRMYEIMSVSTVIFDLHAVDDHTIAILHYNQSGSSRNNHQKYAVQIVDLNDLIVVAEGVFVDAKSAPIAGGNGYLYSVRYDSTAYNPSIVEYAFGN